MSQLIKYLIIALFIGVIALITALVLQDPAVPAVDVKTPIDIPL